MAYTSEPGCPTEATFSAGLRRLMPRLELNSKEDTSRKLEVTFERRESEFVGRLVYGETSREVTAAACADAAYALAVVTAITLEPDAELDETKVDAADFVEADADAAVPDQASAAEPPASAPAEPVQPKPAPRNIEPVPPGDAVAPLPAPEARRWTLLLGPRATYGELGAFAWGGELGALNAGNSWFGAYRVSLRGAYATQDLTVTTLTYTRAGVGLAWCPRFAGNELWQAWACLGGEVDVANVATSETPKVERATSRTGLGVEATLDVVLSIALADRWRLALVPGLVAPLIRNEYVLESSPGVTTRGVRHERLVGSGAVEVGYAFD